MSPWKNGKRRTPDEEEWDEEEQNDGDEDDRYAKTL